MAVPGPCGRLTQRDGSPVVRRLAMEVQGVTLVPIPIPKWIMAGGRYGLRYCPQSPLLETKDCTGLRWIGDDGC